MSAELLPLFPLNTVLYPGVPLPLHVFEERYRILFGELLDEPAPRRFGVVAIRRGLEVGEDAPLLHEVGCVAEIRRVESYDDGRYDIVAVGGPRFRLLGVDDTRPFLRGSVEYLPDHVDSTSVARSAAVVAAFRDYCYAVAAARGDDEVTEPELPVEDPVLVSYVVAAAMHLDLPEKQELLAEPHTTTRLRRELSLLRRETALAEATPDEVPTEGPFSLN